LPDGNTFKDVIPSEKTPQRERRIAAHPSLKPQSFLRQMVYAALPLGEGVVVDPFMGSGSTVAAAEHLGLHSIGLERDANFFAMSEKAVPRLAALVPDRAEREEIIEDHNPGAVSAQAFVKFRECKTAAFAPHPSPSKSPSV
jgi:DNA modification methylase